MGSMPSDLAPISTTRWVAVIFSTVPLMTLSSRAASSLSVVKLSRAEAKSSVVEGCFSSRFWFASLWVESLWRELVCADWGGWGESLFKVEPSGDSTGRSATEVEDAESRLWALLSSGKVDGLSRVFHARGCGDGCGRLADG